MPNSSATGIANVYVDVRPAVGMASTVTGLASELNTDVVVVNTAGVENPVAYTLLDVNVVGVAATENVMEVRAQMACFVNQIFLGEAGDGFTGTLVLSSDPPFTVTPFKPWAASSFRAARLGIEAF